MNSYKQCENSNGPIMPGSEEEPTSSNNVPRESLSAKDNEFVNLKMESDSNSLKTSKKTSIPKVKRNRTSYKTDTNHLETQAIGRPLVNPPIFQKRVMVVNVEARDPKKYDWLVQNQQTLGYTFDPVISEPDVYPSFISKQIWNCSFVLQSKGEMENLVKAREEEKLRGGTWFHKFSVDELMNSPPFLWPYSLNPDQMFLAILTATKIYLDEKMGIHMNQMELEDTINSNTAVKRALHCQRTISHLSSHLNNRGKSFLSTKKRELERNRNK